ncbi:hypothetical protein M413DRAFT_199474 [Hebeloma cylindrosporum]|uniref:Uncharacterized protein n=1 Tax=Hebeloma cylindrosporum TaxID=76867 RepID=A0A0C2YC15_HEBCY|nr:hypothetical protein M413DRAFT_199474 [Hebeloma cylindrosporum h7]
MVYVEGFHPLSSLSPEAAHTGGAGHSPYMLTLTLTLPLFRLPSCQTSNYYSLGPRAERHALERRQFHTHAPELDLRASPSGDCCGDRSAELLR